MQVSNLINSSSTAVLAASLDRLGPHEFAQVSALIKSSSAAAVVLVEQKFDIWITLLNQNCQRISQKVISHILCNEITDRNMEDINISAIVDEVISIGEKCAVLSVKEVVIQSIFLNR